MKDKNWIAIIGEDGYSVIQPDKGIGRVFVAQEICQGRDGGLSDALLIASAPMLLDTLEKISSFSEESGIEGCTYSDTNLDSNSVCYGYNICLNQIKELITKALKETKYEPK